MSVAPKPARALLAAILLTGAISCTRSSSQPLPSVVPPAAGSPPTHGVAAGEVTATSAVLWARCPNESQMLAAIRAVPDGSDLLAAASARAATDFTAKVRFEELTPDTEYRYRVWCGTSPVHVANAAEGRLRTAALPDASRAVRFVWGGDLGGQNVCRDVAEGYSVFDTLAQEDADFFIALGDMIYADDRCLPAGRYGNRQIPGPPVASDLGGFWAHWKYNRADAAFQRFLASTSYYAVWDDHEVVNDFGPHHATPLDSPTGPFLLPIGLAAFLDYNPIIDSSRTPKRLYRSVRWGRHLELLFLDTRQYRDPNFALDTVEWPKTMLGLEQRTWLEERLRASDATWKVIVSSVPLALPTGAAQRGRDGWAGFDQETGFQRELLDLLRHMRDQRVANVVWISTDVHFAAVFRHTPFADDPTFQFHEVETGPLNAGVFPQQAYDTRLGTERLFLYPPSAPADAGWAAAKSWFNFGVGKVDARGQLTLEIVTAEGERIYSLPLQPRVPE